MMRWYKIQDTSMIILKITNTFIDKIVSKIFGPLEGSLDFPPVPPLDPPSVIIMIYLRFKLKIYYEYVLRVTFLLLRVSYV